jgi:predicted nuclease of predicted toxin-antitoxin system
MARLLADENFPGAAVEALKALGNDIVWIRLVMPGCTDSDVLDKAQNEGRLLLTLDKDFGELAFHKGAKARHGIILFRLPPLSEIAFVAFVTAQIQSRGDWAGHFSVVEEDRLRMIQLP